MQDKKFYTLVEISKIYGIPLSTLRRWAAERKFPIYKVSNRVRVSIKEWEDWMEQFHLKSSNTDSSQTKE